MAEVRRVRRIIRRVDPWTVFKVSAIFWAVVSLGLVLGLVMFWSTVNAAGLPQKVTDFLIEITLLEEGSQPFADTDAFLRLAVFGSVFFGVLATGLSTLAAVMYNLIADVVGGVELVVLEETLTPVVRPVPAPPVVQTSSTVDVETEETPVRVSSS
ncbi:MAG: hypothetical protein KatS3mg011_2166 [Acidimicrobiia bacterium]|jgi:preprotein translocase subunit SecY|nr:MAG: hypothetical protein KatS3mg011_2166 [Acidimicrobiia bacterium]